MSQQQNIQMQAQANAQAQQFAAQAEVQKNGAITQNQLQLEQIKAQIDSQKMIQEVQHKKERSKERRGGKKYIKRWQSTTE